MTEHTVHIPPCDDGEPRPLWSVLIPTFNCAGFLREALASVLAQDPGLERMEILVVDDCSDRDDPEAVVAEIGGGRVGFVRQPANVGKVRNYETGLLASRGTLIHQLHGDDRVKQGFYRSMETAFADWPAAGAIFCESEYINENGTVTGRTGRERDGTGLLDDWLPRLAEAQRIQTPSMVVRREVYEALGGFDRRLDCSEDWEMWLRIANRYPMGFCAEALAQYRYSASNNSARSILNGTRGRVQRLMFEIVNGYLPEEVTARVKARRAREQALFFADQIPKVMRANGFAGWLRLCREAMGFSCEAFVVRRLVSLTLRVLAGRR